MPIGFWAISRREIAEWHKDLYGKEIDNKLLNSIINNLPFILNKTLDDYVLPRFSGIES